MEMSNFHAETAFHLAGKKILSFARQSGSMAHMSADLSVLPSVDRLTRDFAEEISLPRPLLVAALRRGLAGMRARLLAGDNLSRKKIETELRADLRHFAASRLQAVVNATGVMIHTNLGRSPMGARAMDAVAEVAQGYSNLEFNLPGGGRGKRAAYLEEALVCILETEAATAVNNCAAALVLTLRALISPEKNEVLVSRSELVEIGGGFRVPEILETSGAKLVEVGATNKTHLHDYQNALTPRSALILKVHRSNFYLGGFTGEPAIPELAALAQKADIPLIEDLGSGALMATDELAPIEHEPTPQEQLRQGIGLVTFSGDKLLGGPQSGIIAGRADLVARVKKEPFFRAVRCDKLILAALQECIDDYLSAKEGKGKADIPVLTFLSTPPERLRARAEAILKKLPAWDGKITITESLARTGGGTMPRAEIPSVALKVIPDGGGVSRFADQMRLQKPAVVGYLADGAYFLDLRSVFPEQDELLLHALQNVTTTK